LEERKNKGRPTKLQGKKKEILQLGAAQEEEEREVGKGGEGGAKMLRR